MMEWIAAVLLVVGSAFSLIASIGVLRFPDVFTRMHAASKAASFGIGLTLLGSAFAFGTGSAFAKAVFTILFVFLTTPVSTHLLSRVARKRIERGVDEAV